ncbi:MAG: AEC family transporter [Alphaproteobacteria bacterium]|nr:AEC family transporter [Alphaproteobacteria bacterium]
MDAILNVSLPVFAIILGGYLAARSGLLGQGSTVALNAFVYYFALPPLLFLSMARVPLTEIFHWPYLAAYVGGVLGTLALSLAAGFLVFGGRPAELSLQSMTAVFSNTGYMGVPLFLTAFGDTGVLPALILTVFNGAVVVGVVVSLIELDLSKGGHPFRILGDVGLALLRNPLVMAAVVGIVWSALHLPLPKPLSNFCEILGAASGPCALFAMGLSLVAHAGGGRLAEAGWLAFLKLLVQPAITAWLAFGVLALDPFWAMSAVILAAMPTGTLTFVIAQRYGLYATQATQATLVSTVLSVVTVSGLLAWFRIG